MYHTTVNNIQSHDHTLPVNEMPSHSHCHSHSAALSFEVDDFVININQGTMLNITHNQLINNDIFLNNMCDCIVSRFAGHNINLFKAGNSNELKERILNFLKKEIE